MILHQVSAEVVWPVKLVSRIASAKPMHVDKMPREQFCIQWTFQEVLAAVGAFAQARTHLTCDIFEIGKSSTRVVVGIQLGVHET